MRRVSVSRLLRDFASFAIVLSSALLVSRAAQAIDYNYPFWRAVTPTNVYIEQQGDSLAVGKAVAAKYTKWLGRTPTSCKAWGIGSAMCYDGAISWGNSSRYCSLPLGFKVVGESCVYDGQINQPTACSPEAGNPVVIGNGAKRETVADYSTSGTQSLTFERTYQSAFRVSAAGTATFKPLDISRFGRAWRTPYDTSIVFSNSSPASVANGDRAHIRLPDSFELAFVYSSSLSKWQPAYFNWATAAWVAPRLDIDIAFTITGGQARVTQKNGDAWVYGLTGRLNEIQYKSGYTQTLGYTGTNNTSITDNLGRSLTFAYDARNLLTSMTTPDGKLYKYDYTNLLPDVADSGEFILSTVIHPDSTPATDADNPKTTYHYENATHPYALTGITDERGVRYATWTYDIKGRVLTSSHAGGADTYTFAYDDVTNKRTVTNPLGKQTTYHFQLYQGRQRITKVEGIASANCAASDTTYAYDTVGFVNQTTDGEGRITKYTNNARGLPETIVEGFGTPEARTTTLTWHASLNKPTQIVEPRLTSTLAYDAAGNLTSLTQTDTTSHTLPYSTNGQTRVWTYTYSPQGLLLTVNGPLTGTGDTVTYTYDANGFIDTITNEMSHVTQVISKNANGQPLTVRDANGVDTTLTYDDRNRLATVTVNPGPAQAVTSLTYDANSNITRITRPDGAYLNYTYDDAKRVTVIADNTGSKIELGYDNMGNVTSRSIKDPANTVTFTQSQAYDELGRLLRQIGAATQTTVFAYDKTDNLKTVTDPRSNVYTYAYDALSRLIRETDQETEVVNYGLDGRDGLATYTDPRTLVTSYVRNGFGEAIQEASPDAGTTVYVRNARGLVTQSTDGRGVVTNYVFDNLGRETSRSFPSAVAETVTSTWDSTAAGNKGVGRLTSLADQSGTTGFVYDARGNVVGNSRAIGANTYAVAYDYDAADAITRIVYPSGREVAVTRNALGQISGITTKKNALASSVTVASGVTYYPMSEVVADFAYGNGLSYEARLTQDYWLDTMRLMDGATNIMARAYGYTDNLNLTNIADYVTPAESQSLWYTGTRRLQNASGSYGDYTYYYDGVGNRTHEILVQGAVTTTRQEGYPGGSNRIAGVLTNGTLTRSFTHDGAGNTLTDTQGSDVATYGYNARNRLATLTRNGSPWATYQYNALEQLVARTVTAPVGPTGTIHYIYDQQGQLIAEADAATGATLREYIWLDDMPVAVVTDIAAATPTIYAVHVDHLKRPIAMSDAAKAMVWQARWLPYGAPQSITGTASLDARFPGQWFQIESGLHYNWHRHYDPSIGRYTQPDPLGFVDGPSVFAYAGNSPLMQIDKDGRLIWLLPAIARGVIIGASANFAVQFGMNLGANGLDWRLALKCIDIADVAISGALGGVGLGVVGNAIKGDLRRAAAGAALGAYLKAFYPPIPITVGKECECKNTTGLGRAIGNFVH